MDAKPAKKSKKQRTSGAGSSSSPGPSTATPAASATTPAAATPVAAPPLPAVPAQPVATEESLPHLACTVCLSFPEKDILQCNSGHIMCRQCHDRVCAEERPQCPTCRDVLDISKEVRNTLAEQTIAMLAVACPNEPCAAALTRGTLDKHLKDQCAFRPVCCKYALLGCKWGGIASGRATHEDSCKRADMPGWKLLEKVKAKQEAEKAEHRVALAEAQKGQKVLHALMGRCRNAEVSHVVLHKCSGHEHVAGKPAHLVSAAFHALGSRWKVYTVHNPDSSTTTGRASYSAVLQLRDDVRVQMPVDGFVLRGPQQEHAGMSPAPLSHVFSGASRQRTTELVLLAEGADADALEQLDKLELRVGLVDRRAGRMSSGFLGHVPRGYGYGDGGGGGGGGDSEEGWGDGMDGEDDDDMDDGSEGEYSDSGSGPGFHGPPGGRHERFY